MNLLSRIKSRLTREDFQPTFLGVVFNPVFIVRNGLYKTIKFFALHIKGEVLDFGCGSKPYENLFVESSNYIGCDVKESGHNHSDSKIDDFIEENILPFERGRFDAVVSFEVFEHLFDIDKALLEINRVTKPEGYLLVSVPFVWSEHEVPYDYARYTSFGMKHILESHGFEIVELKKTVPFVLTIFQLLIAYLIRHVLPQNKLYYIFQIVLIFPLTVFAYLVNAFLPKRYDLFCNLVVLAKKTKAK